jgi:hypothetical protein
MLRVSGSYSITWGVRKRYFDEAVATWAKTLQSFEEEIHNQISENKTFTQNLFLGEAAGAIISGVWSALRTWDDITSQTGGVGPATPEHIVRRHDFNGKLNGSLKRATPRRAVLKEWDIDEYGFFSADPRQGDGLAGHEVLQNAWLKANGYIEKRGVGWISRGNPAIAVSKKVHLRIGMEQEKLGLFDPAQLVGMTPRRNIELNIQALKNAGAPGEVIFEIKQRALKYAKELPVPQYR